MAYTLQAIIGESGSFSSTLPQKLHSIALRGGVDMIPLTSEALACHDILSFLLAEEAGEEVPPQLLSLCEQLSTKCSLAYIEAEFFGGAGTQAHAFFSEGKAVGRAVISENAINEALRYLGVKRGEAHDEFEAVGLDQHRDTDAWLA